MVGGGVQGVWPGACYGRSYSGRGGLAAMAHAAAVCGVTCRPSLGCHGRTHLAGFGLLLHLFPEGFVSGSLAGHSVLRSADIHTGLRARRGGVKPFPA